MRSERHVWRRAAFSLPLMLLTVRHQEKHQIKVKSAAEEMLYNGGDVCTMLNSSKASAISDELV